MDAYIPIVKKISTMRSYGERRLDTFRFRKLDTLVVEYFRTFRIENDCISECIEQDTESQSVKTFDRLGHSTTEPD